jgi:glycosyltransferase involved in cell wall biosynthesis
VQKQKFPSEWEIVLISQNVKKTILGEIEKQFTSMPIRVIEDSGVGIVSALNLGLMNCKYELVARFDSDDIMIEGRIVHQISAMKDKRLVAVGGQLDIIDLNGSIIGEARYPISSALTGWSLSFTCALPHPGTTFLKSAVLSVGGYRSEFEVAEDYDLWIRLAQIGKVKNLRQKVIQYRRHPFQSTNLMSSKNRLLANKLIILQNAGNETSRVIWEKTMEIMDLTLIENFYPLKVFLFLKLTLINPKYILKKLAYRAVLLFRL